MQQMLVATDLSQRSESALSRAAHLATATGASITMLHVVDEALPSEMVDEITQQARARLMRHLENHPELKAEVMIHSGDPHAEILRIADGLAADLILLGGHRRRTLFDEFIGTTAERVLRMSSRPVLVVHQAVQGGYEDIMAATDFSDHSAHAIRVARDLGLLSPTFKLVHVFTYPAKSAMYQAGIDPSGRIEEERVAVSQRLVAFLRQHGLDARSARHAILREGRARHQIQSVVKEHEPQLVVLGTRGLSRVKRALLGSVAESLIRTLPSDILAVPPATSR